MRHLFWALTALAAIIMAMPAQAAAPTKNTAAAPRTSLPPMPDSQQIEADLQRLPWPQFRTVIESIPKLKADVEAHGKLGWAFVQTNYKTHPWKKNIDRLDDAQRRQLVDKIRQAQKTPSGRQ